MVQLSHLYMTIGKTVTLVIQTFVSKVLSLLFNMLSRFFFFFNNFQRADSLEKVLLMLEKTDGKREGGGRG